LVTAAFAKVPVPLEVQVELVALPARDPLRATVVVVAQIVWFGPALAVAGESTVTIALPLIVAVQVDPAVVATTV
jgi:hypothetical protein